MKYAINNLLFASKSLFLHVFLCLLFRVWLKGILPKRIFTFSSAQLIFYCFTANWLGWAFSKEVENYPLKAKRGKCHKKHCKNWKYLQICVNFNAFRYFFRDKNCFIDDTITLKKKPFADLFITKKNCQRLTDISWTVKCSAEFCLLQNCTQSVEGCWQWNG